MKNSFVSSFRLNSKGEIYLRRSFHDSLTKKIYQNVLVLSSKGLTQIIGSFFNVSE